MPQICCGHPERLLCALDAIFAATLEQSNNPHFCVLCPGGFAAAHMCATLPKGFARISRGGRIDRRTYKREREQKRENDTHAL